MVITFSSCVVVCGQHWSVFLAYGGHGGSGEGVTLEVGSA